MDSNPRGTLWQMNFPSSSTVCHPPSPPGGWAMKTVLTVNAVGVWVARGAHEGWATVGEVARDRTKAVRDDCQPYCQPFRVLPAVF